MSQSRKITSNLKHIKEEQQRHKKQQNSQKVGFNLNDKNWIGEIPNKKIIENKLQTSIPKTVQMSRGVNQNIQQSISRKNGDSPLTKLANSLYRNQDSYISNSQKNPMQLMNDIFRGIGLNHLSNSKTYYSKEVEDNLCQLLSNKNKMSNYIKKLSSQMSQASPQIQKNYEILLILLQQLNQTDIQVHQDQNGMKILFNRSQLFQKENQIQRLEKELQQKTKQTEKIVQQYEGVIRNFNDVIEKLIQQKKY